MTVYLSSPCTQQQADHVSGLPVLLSFATYRPWLARYQQSFSRILIDSGAYSEFATGKKIDLEQYKDWCEQWTGHVDAIAGLDDISGDWRRSLKNYADFPAGFPTIHDSDPPELLKDLIAIAIERNGWLGIGLEPPRQGKEKFVRWVCDNVPERIHLHGWALRAYSQVRRVDSFDSTNWFRDGFAICANPLTKHLTYGEALEIVIKRYQRELRCIREVAEMPLFDTEGELK